jgi:hypothetical protein
MHNSFDRRGRAALAGGIFLITGSLASAFGRAGSRNRGEDDPPRQKAGEQEDKRTNNHRYSVHEWFRHKKSILSENECARQVTCLFHWLRLLRFTTSKEA